MIFLNFLMWWLQQYGWLFYVIWRLEQVDVVCFKNERHFCDLKGSWSKFDLIHVTSTYCSSRCYIWLNQLWEVMFSRFWCAECISIVFLWTSIVSTISMAIDAICVWFTYITFIVHHLSLNQLNLPWKVPWSWLKYLQTQSTWHHYRYPLASIEIAVAAQYAVWNKYGCKHK